MRERFRDTVSNRRFRRKIQAGGIWTRAALAILGKAALVFAALSDGRMAPGRLRTVVIVMIRDVRERDLGAFAGFVHRHPLSHPQVFQVRSEIMTPKLKDEKGSAPGSVATPDSS